jgi:D-glycero-alpha-D-manno-heptose-7-phosphate kinase
MIITRTPLRISFFGGGTDYPAWFGEHPAAVLGTTIDKYVYVTCRYLPPVFPHTIRVSYSKMEYAMGIEEVEHPAVRECLRHMGIDGNVEIHTDADLPARTGLGSSSTFTVGLLNALHAYAGRMSCKEELAKEAIHIEQDVLRDTVGCQDQVFAAYGGLNRIEFTPRGFQVSPVVLSTERLAEFQSHLMIFFTGISRNASEFAADQLSNMPKKTHELQEMCRLVDEGIKELVSDRSLKHFGELLHETWLLKRALSTKITNGLVDDSYKKARQLGAYGGKLLGAGGGGFLLVFADPECHDAIRDALFPFPCVPVELESSGTQIIFYNPRRKIEIHSKAATTGVNR